MHPTLFFDLDGTLTDSGPGIMNCAQLALEAYGIQAPREALRAFVGPPLRVSFARFGVPEGELEHAIARFRGRYQTVGKFENFPYPGIPELLEQLHQEGFPLYVATSKPEVTAKEILSHFHLDGYFLEICGATMDSSRENKADVIAYLLQKAGGPHGVLMIGDTDYDVLGAAAHGIPTIGVSWGYGTANSMAAAGALAVVDTPQALFAQVCAGFSRQK